jgi:hypothetical protein
MEMSSGTLTGGDVDTGTPTEYAKLSHGFRKESTTRTRALEEVEETLPTKMSVCKQHSLNLAYVEAVDEKETLMAEDVAGGSLVQRQAAGEKVLRIARETCDVTPSRWNSSR